MIIIGLAKIETMVAEELNRAIMAYPNWPDDLVRCAAFVAEEAGELIKAANEYDDGTGSINEMREEAVQTAAMAIRFLLNLEES